MNRDAYKLFSLILQCVKGFLFVSIFLFGAAGSFSYPEIWIFLLGLFVFAFSFIFWLHFCYPNQITNRLKFGETDAKQRSIVIMLYIITVIALIISGLDMRFNWSARSHFRYIPAAFLFLVSAFIYRNVFISNPFLSNTLEIQNEHKVVISGMYGIVRHPMYLATLLLFISGLLVLGSWINILMIFAFVLLLTKRIAFEEKQLLASIPEYKKYTLSTKFRLVPYVW